MTARELMRIVKRLGCTTKPGKGGHVKVTCGTCSTVIAMHGGDVPKGTLHAIIRDLEPCLGKSWHKE